MTEITFDFTGLLDAITLFLESLFGALGGLFAELAAFFSNIVISYV